MKQDNQSSSKRDDSKNICTGQVLKLLRESDNIRIKDSIKNNWLRQAKVIGQRKSPQSNIIKLKMEIAAIAVI